MHWISIVSLVFVGTKTELRQARVYLLIMTLYHVLPYLRSLWETLIFHMAWLTMVIHPLKLILSAKCAWKISFSLYLQSMSHLNRFSNANIQMQIRPSIQDHNFSKTLLNTPPQYKRGGLRQAESTSVFMVMEIKLQCQEKALQAMFFMLSQSTHDICIKRCRFC